MGVEATTGFKGDRISVRKLANARRCIICYTELDTVGHKEVSMKNLVDASKDLFGVRVRSGLAKAGYFRMCEECFSEFTELDFKRQERPGKLDEKTKEECAKYATKIVDSIKSSQYVSNNVFGDPFDAFRFLIFKDWRKACMDGFEDEDGSFRLPDSCPLLKIDLPIQLKPAVLRSTQPAAQVEPTTQPQIKQEIIEPAPAAVAVPQSQTMPFQVPKNTRVIFVKRDPTTGETVQVTNPGNSNGVIRGKMNGKNVIIMSKEPAAKGFQQVRTVKRVAVGVRNQDIQSNDFYIDASSFVSTELKVGDDETEETTGEGDQDDYMPNLDGVDISFADPTDRSSSPEDKDVEGMDQLKYDNDDDTESTPSRLVVRKKKPSPKGVTISPDVSKVSMEVVRSQRSGRVINKRTYDADWVTGSAVNQIFQGMKPMKVTSPANKKSKADNQQAS